jgi:tetratricopeptide (TPR) repeat protein
MPGFEEARAADPDSPSPDGTAAAAPTAPSSLLARLRPLLWPVLCCFLAGLLVSVTLLRPSRPEVRKDPSWVSDKIGAPSETEAARIGPDTQDRGDELAREGRYDQALSIFRSLSLKAASPAWEALQYRTALCQEGLGQWEQAVAGYRSLAERGTYLTAQAAAQVGQARIWLRLRKTAEAKLVLYALNLRSGQEPLRSHALLGEVKYLLALTLLQEAVPGADGDPVQETMLGPGNGFTDLLRGLDWASPPGIEKKTPAREIFEVSWFGKESEGSLVTAFGPPQPAADLLEKLTAGSGWKTNWSDAARKRIQGRHARPALDKAAVVDVVQALTDPFGVVWRLENEILHFSAEEEASKELLAKHRAQVARRVTREALLTFPGHPLTMASYLQIGNLEAAEGKWADAAVWVERLLREASDSQVLTEAYYNLGLIRQRLGQAAEGRAAFLRVIDQAPAGEMAPLAYLRLGRLHLDQAEFAQAVRAFDRAVTGSAVSSLQPAVAVHLAAAHLLGGKPETALEVLRKHKVAASREYSRRTAALIDALARLQLAERRGGAPWEAPELFAALLNLAGEQVLGPAQKVLEGRAYQALGMGPSMARIYEAALQTTKGALAEEMTFSLAEHLEASNKRSEAARMFDALATLTGSQWAPPAQLALAKIAFAEDRCQECLLRCRRLLREPGTVDRPAILELMGRCFSRRGEYGRAAQCFAGQEPTGQPD